MQAEAWAHLGHRTEAQPLMLAAYKTLLQKEALIPAEKRPILDTVRNWKLQIP